MTPPGYVIIPLDADVKTATAAKDDWRFGRSRDHTHLSPVAVSRTLHKLVRRVLKTHPDHWRVLPFEMTSDRSPVAGKYKTINAANFDINKYPKVENIAKCLFLLTCHSSALTLYLLVVNDSGPVIIYQNIICCAFSNPSKMSRGVRNFFHNCIQADRLKHNFVAIRRM